MNRYAKPSNFGHPIRTPLLRKHYVYRAFAADGRLLYVGCTQDPKQRLADHKMQSKWHAQMRRLKIAGPYNYETARQLEYDAIEGERPQFNYTREHRALAGVRSRMIDREIAHRGGLGVPGWEWFVHEAVAKVEGILGRDLHAAVITDLTVPTFRKIEQDHADSLAGVR